MYEVNPIDGPGNYKRADGTIAVLKYVEVGKGTTFLQDMTKHDLYLYYDTFENEPTTGHKIYLGDKFTIVEKVQ